MSWHVIVPFQGVPKCPITIPFCWNNLVERYFHISPNIRIGIFVNRQARRRVLDEKIHHADFDPGETFSITF